MKIIPEEDRLVLLDVVTDQIKNYLLKTPIKYYDVPDSIRRKYGGAFVSLYNGGELRGCVGIIRNDMTLFNIIKDVAWKACIDSRFPRITEEEVLSIIPKVSVLSEKKKIEHVDEIDIGIHGIIVEQSRKLGIFLPEVAPEQNWDAEQFVYHCIVDKARGTYTSSFDLYTFETDLIE